MADRRLWGMMRLVDTEGALPAQWGGPSVTGVEGERDICRWLLRDAHREILRFANGASGRVLSRLLNLIAWIEDVDGFRARDAGVPYAVAFRGVVEAASPDVEAEAVVAALRTRYATVLNDARAGRPTRLKRRAAA